MELRVRDERHGHHGHEPVLVRRVRRRRGSAGVLCRRGHPLRLDGLRRERQVVPGGDEQRHGHHPREQLQLDEQAQQLQESETALLKASAAVRAKRHSGHTTRRWLSSDARDAVDLWHTQRSSLSVVPCARDALGSLHTA